MTPITNKPVSVRPGSPALFWGVGNSANYFSWAQPNQHGIDFRLETLASSGNSRAAYFRLRFNGTGEGEAVRAYAETMAANVATGGTVNGLHASLALIAGSSVSGQGFAARFTIDAAAATRTINGNLGAILAESNFGTGNTVPATVALIHLKEIGAVTCKKAFRFPNATSGGMVAAHTTQTMTHSIRCVTDDGTLLYIMCTDTATNRAGGA